MGYLKETILAVIGDSATAEVLAFVIEYFAIYLLCFIGGLVKDSITAHKFHSKLDIIDLIIYPIPCSFIVVALHDLLSSKFEVEVSYVAFAAAFIGSWAREIVAFLTNNKFMMIVSKLFAKIAISKVGGLSEEEKDKLTEALENGIKDAMEDDAQSNLIASFAVHASVDDGDPEDELSGNHDPVGEYEWIEILEEEEDAG